MDKINFYLGEKKKIEAKVTIENQISEFVIDNASYKLFLNDTITVSGECVIDNVNKSFAISLEPINIGKHILEFTYSVADEIIKDKVLILVS